MLYALDRNVAPVNRDLSLNNSYVVDYSLHELKPDRLKLSFHLYSTNRAKTSHFLCPEASQKQ